MSKADKRVKRNKRLENDVLVELTSNVKVVIADSEKILKETISLFTPFEEMLTNIGDNEELQNMLAELKNTVESVHNAKEGLSKLSSKGITINDGEEVNALISDVLLGQLSISTLISDFHSKANLTISQGE